MKVKFKQTGQIGTIPDENFDPNVFEKINTDILGNDMPTLAPIKDSEIIDNKPTILGNILGGGESINEMTDRLKKEQEERDRKASQIIVPAATIAAGIATGGMSIPASALLTGLAGGGGELLRQQSMQEPLDLKKAGKEALWSGGTQAAAMGVGKLISKATDAAKTAKISKVSKLGVEAKAAKAAKVASPNGLVSEVDDVAQAVPAGKKGILGKAGEALEKKSSGFKTTSKLKVKDPLRAAKAKEVEDLLLSNGVYKEGAVGGSQKVADIYETHLNAVRKGAAKSLNPVNGAQVAQQLDDDVLTFVDDLTKEGKSILNRYKTKIANAKTVSELNAIDAEVRGITSQMTGGISIKKNLYTQIQKTIAGEMQTQLPEYAQHFQKMMETYKMAPAVNIAADDLINGSIVGIGPKGVNIEVPKLVRQVGTKLGVGLEKLDEVAQGLSTKFPGVNFSAPQIEKLLTTKMLEITDEVGNISTIYLGDVLKASAIPGIQSASYNSRTGLPQPTETGLPAMTSQTGLAPIGETGTTTDIGMGKQEQTTSTGYTIEQLKDAAMKALIANDTKAYTQLKKMYDLESAYQKQTKGAGEKAIPSAQVTDISDIKSSIKLADDIIADIGKTKMLMGPITGRARSYNPYDTNAQIFKGKMMLAAQNIGRALEGGVLRQEDVKKYLKILPQISDTPAVAAQKMENVKEQLRIKLQQRVNELESSGYTSTGTASTFELPAPTSTGLDEL